MGYFYINKDIKIFYININVNHYINQNTHTIPYEFGYDVEIEIPSDYDYSAIKNLYKFDGYYNDIKLSSGFLTDIYKEKYIVTLIFKFDSQTLLSKSEIREIKLKQLLN